MTDIVISYARSTELEAKAIAEALRAAGYGVWLDDELPAHRGYAEVIEERLEAAKAVVVIWSAEAAKSEWVQSEADKAREGRKLVQLSIDGAKLPMPFDRIQCADLAGWAGDTGAPGWRKVVASIADLVGGAIAESEAAADVPLSLPTKPSIAVLPFANLSGDPEQDYFADGMVEEVARALSRFKSLFVIGGGSSLSFKGQIIAPREAGRLLGVRYVLEGSVRKAGGRVRIAVKLIDATDGAQIWSDRFEDTLEDVFALQDEVALAVAGVIGPAVLEAEIRHAAARPTNSIGSYDLYLRALALLRTMAKADTSAALDLLNRAIALDPDHGSALATAAYCHALIIAFGWFDEAESHFSEAASLTQRAIKAASDDPDVLGPVATITLMLGGDVESAAALADRAMALNPGSALVWASDALVRLYRGQPDLAYEHLATALRLDPLRQTRAQLIGMQGMARFAQRRFAEAVPLLRQSAQLMPQWGLPPAVLAANHGHLSETNAAREAMARFAALSSVSLSDWAASFTEPELRKLLLDGIALAEGAAAPESAGSN